MLTPQRSEGRGAAQHQLLATLLSEVVPTGREGTESDQRRPHLPPAWLSAPSQGCSHSSSMFEDNAGTDRTGVGYVT